MTSDAEVREADARVQALVEEVKQVSAEGKRQLLVVEVLECKGFNCEEVAIELELEGKAEDEGGEQPDGEQTEGGNEGDDEEPEKTEEANARKTRPLEEGKAIEFTLPSFDAAFDLSFMGGGVTVHVSSDEVDGVEEGKWKYVNGDGSGGGDDEGVADEERAEDKAGVKYVATYTEQDSAEMTEVAGRLNAAIVVRDQLRVKATKARQAKQLAERKKMLEARAGTAAHARAAAAQTGWLKWAWQGTTGLLAGHKSELLFTAGVLLMHFRGEDLAI
ncbi:unnamed protein product [Chrysoparadoxa australica]